MAAVVSAAELVAAFQAALPVPVISHSTATPRYDLYEVYLFGVVVRAAESIGMTIRFEDAAGNLATELVLRRSPSTIWSAAEPFRHATLLLDGVPRLEVHLGIYVRAGSGISHEADVAVIDAAEAARSRALRIDPRIGQVATIIEAKFHGANIRLRTGREFLGLVADLGGGPPIFVSSSPGVSVHRLLSYRKRSGHFSLTPGAPQEAELKAQVATKLRDYVARRS
jgi:hypothetical protein